LGATKESAMSSNGPAQHIRQTKNPGQKKKNKKVVEKGCTGVGGEKKFDCTEGEGKKKAGTKKGLKGKKSARRPHNYKCS